MGVADTCIACLEWECAVGHDVVLSLMEAEVSGYMALARDIWLLSFWMGGINWCDMRGLDWSGETVTFERSKTKGRGHSRLQTTLPICKEAREILKRRSPALQSPRYRQEYAPYQV